MMKENTHSSINKLQVLDELSKGGYIKFDSEDKLGKIYTIKNKYIANVRKVTMKNISSLLIEKKVKVKKETETRYYLNQENKKDE